MSQPAFDASTLAAIQRSVDLVHLMNPDATPEFLADARLLFEAAAERGRVNAERRLADNRKKRRADR